MATEQVTYQLSLRDLMSKGLGEINQKMTALEKSLGRVEGKTKKAESSIFNSFNAMKSAVSGFVGAMAVGEIISFGTETVYAAAKMEGMTNAIKFASGSAEEGAKNIEFLKNITRKMPIDLIAAEEGFKTFSGAVMGTSLEGDKARKIFTAVSKSASVMGLSADDTKGVFLALGQMVSKGTVQAEELKGQLGERLTGAFRLAAESMGLTTAQLGDYMKAGKITAEDLLPRLALQLEKTYNRGMGEANNSINAQIVRLGNWKHELVEGSIPTVKLFMQSLVGMGQSIISSWEPMRDAFTGFGDVFMASMEPLERFFGLFSDSKIVTLENFFKVLGSGIVMLTTPLAVISDLFTSIYEVGSSIINLDWNRLTKIGDNLAINKVGENLKNIWTDDAQKKSGSGFKSNMLNIADKLGVSGADKLAPIDFTGNAEKAKKAKLSEQVSGVSGGAPKVVNITIEALIKDVKNYFGSAGSAINDSKAFLDQLQSALNTIVLDSGIVAQNGR